MDFSQKLTSPRAAKKFIFDLCQNDLDFHFDEDVKDILNYTILTLDVRQNPQHQLAELFQGLWTKLEENTEQVRKSSMQQPPINSMGQ